MTLFLVPTASGEGPLYSTLASQLEQNSTPVHALAEPQQPVSFRTSEATAAWYVRCIRTLQPGGPYRLAGGRMAYEVATQLIGENEQIEYLALFDTLVFDDAYSIPARVHLFLTENREVTLGWNALLRPQQIETSIVSRDHDSTLAKAVSQSLQGAAQRPSPPRANRAALLSLQTGRAGSAPLFCVPGAGDNVMAFASLCEALGPRFTLSGFQPQGLMGHEVPHSSVEAAARSYVQALLREHPTGPYHLLGHSFGGWIIFEIAAQMRALGRRPASIAMIDTDAPGQPPREYSRIEALLELAGVFELHATSPLNLKPASFEPLNKTAQLKLLQQRLMQAGLLPAGSDVQDLAAIFRVFATNVRTSYRPRALCEQPVDLLWVPEKAEQTPLSAEAWREWAPDLRLHRLAGNHVTLLDPPHVSGLAHALQSVMNRAIAP